jgi:chemosensory pili system protein ChpC
MSQLTIPGVEIPDMVDCLVAEMTDESLLLPMAAVAEVVREVIPREDIRAPGWMYGWLDWRGMDIPLCSFEALSGRDMPALPQPAHAVILNTLDNSGQMPFFALLMQHFPGPVRVAEDDALQALALGDEESAMLMKLVLGKQTVYIPNLEQLEAQLLQGLSGSMQ